MLELLTPVLERFARDPATTLAILVVGWRVGRQLARHLETVDGKIEHAVTNGVAQAVLKIHRWQQERGAR